MPGHGPTEYSMSSMAWSWSAEPAVTVGDRLLALPGRYTVTASLEGYRPLQETVTVSSGGLQEFRLQLEARRIVRSPGDEIHPIETFGELVPVLR